MEQNNSQYISINNNQINIILIHSIYSKTSKSQMKKYQYNLKSYQKHTSLPISKQIEEFKNSLTSIKNKNQFYIQIEASLVNVFVFYALANKQFMEKQQINSLFFKLVDPKDHKQIENIYKKYLQFQRDINSEFLIDRVKIVHDTIKSHFQKLSKAKQFCDDQKVIGQLYSLYPNVTFKLKHQRKAKNGIAYIKLFQIKGTNRVILAFFQQKIQEMVFQQTDESINFEEQKNLNNLTQEINKVKKQDIIQIKKQKLAAQKDKQRQKNEVSVKNKLQSSLQKHNLIQNTLNHISFNSFNLTKLKQYTYQLSKKQSYFHYVFPAVLVIIVIFFINLICKVWIAFYQNIEAIIYTLIYEIIPIIPRLIYSIIVLVLSSIYDTFTNFFILAIGIITSSLCYFIISGIVNQSKKQSKILDIVDIVDQKNNNQ